MKYVLYFLLALMSLSQPSLAAQPTVDKDVCEWNAGQNRYTGDKLAAVDQLTHIPAETRAKIKAKMKDHVYDDMVEIDGRKIVSLKYGEVYQSRITNMRFGWGGRCKEVTRSKWAAGKKEFALVYSADGYVVIDPETCGNIAQIYDAPGPVTSFSLPPVEPIEPVAFVPPVDPSFEETLIMDPPGYGLPPSSPPPMFFVYTQGPYIPGVVVTSPIPEPPVWMMLGVGIAVFLARKKKWKSSRSSP